mgnify:CR=1 FL=1
MSRARTWCYTCHSHDKHDVDVDVCVRYFIEQLETSPETEKQHLQGYIELNKPQRLSWLKKHFCNEAHWEVRHGTRDQARDYCRKDETRKDGPWEYGDWTAGGSGTRNDIIATVRAIKNDKRKLSDLYQDEEHLVVCAKYPKYLDRLVKIITPDRSEMTELHIFIGPTGTGKSHTAREMAGDDYFYKDPTTKWWDGYENQPVVVIDDFKGQISLNYMLRLIDKYPFNVEIKGGDRKFTSKIVVITSNSEVEEWWNNEQKGYEKQLAAFGRRIFSKKHFLIKHKN